MVDAAAAINLLNNLGFLVNYEKSVLIPNLTMEYLGLIIYPSAMSFSLSNTKVINVISMGTEALNEGFISLRKVASILVNFTWAIPTIPFA